LKLHAILGHIDFIIIWVPKDLYSSVPNEKYGVLPKRDVCLGRFHVIHDILLGKPDL